MSKPNPCLESWGRYPPAKDQSTLRTQWSTSPLPSLSDGRSLLPYGLGRSYGDSCLNEGGALLVCDRMDRVLDFDAEGGSLRCEAGLSLAAILDIIVPRGWFLPVTPGTKYITVGGAIANDVHGKNHHRSGTFGCHVTAFELLRSNGERLICTPTENGDWFRATIGGLGLTGLITWAEFDLKKVHGPWIEMESIKFRNVDEFFELARASDADFDYTVAWVDCLAQGEQLGRGIYMRGNSAGAEITEGPKGHGKKQKTFPFDAPGLLLNKLSVKAFNFLYYGKQRQRVVEKIEHYDPFFYPLDSVHHWNRMYGKRGFFQHQCLVPLEGSCEPIKEILRLIAESGQASFLAVLKVCGDIPSPGLLSFPQPGVTLALDFPNNGKRTLELMDRMDEIVRKAGGREYPAKDARMSAESFQAFYPNWRELLPFIDPAFSSSFWWRVTSPENP